MRFKAVSIIATLCAVMFVASAGAAEEKTEKAKRTKAKGKTKVTKKAKPAAGWDSPLPGAEAIVYKTVGDVELRLHMFKPEGWKAKDSRAAVVCFFGGGWTGGTPKQFAPHSAYLASRGMVAFSAEYRIKSRHKTTPFECTADGKSAIRYVRANAKKLGVDRDRIVAAGGSAGGHVAAATALVPGCDEKGEDTSVSCVPNAMALFNPVIDTTESGWSGGVKQLGDRAKELSPLHYVKKSTPPAIVFHGTKDTTVPFENAERFARLMKEAGVRCELVPYEGKGHGFFNEGRAGNADYLDSVRRMDVFLTSLGYLEGEPTIDAK